MITFSKKCYGKKEKFRFSNQFILKINNKLNARQCEKTKIYKQRPNNEQIRRFKRL